MVIRDGAMAPVFSVPVIMGQVSSEDKLSQWLGLAPGLPLSQDMGWVISQKQNLGHSKGVPINNSSNFVRSEYTSRTFR